MDNERLIAGALESATFRAAKKLAQGCWVSCRQFQDLFEEAYKGDQHVFIWVDAVSITSSFENDSPKMTIHCHFSGVLRFECYCSLVKPAPPHSDRNLLPGRVYIHKVDNMPGGDFYQNLVK